MLKLASLIENPAEPAITTAYHDARVLHDLGYNGLVVYRSVGFSGIARADQISDPEMRQWAKQTFEDTSRIVQGALEGGLDAYLCYDVLALPTDDLHRDGQALTCIDSETTLCPASEAALARGMTALDALLTDQPQVSGIVLRFGDTDASRLPHLTGNDIYEPHCARCSQMGRADRVVNVITHAYETVVKRHNKRLIVRAWNVKPSGFHDEPELAQRIIERLPGEADDDRLVLSFKFSQTDFWRFQKWNSASLIAGDKKGFARPILYELQCQREYEGKGSVPNWQAPLWRDGPPETCPTSESYRTTGTPDEQGPALSGLAAVTEQINFAGIMSWVRGGGWGGPFIKDESWVDANAYAAPRLADNPSASLETLAQGWVNEKMGITAPDLVSPICRVLMRSAESTRLAFYMGPYASTKGNPWHPAADWISDDQLDVNACWRMISRVPMSQLNELIDEKRTAVDRITQDRRALKQAVNDATALGTRSTRLEHMVNTLAYTQSLFETLRDLVTGLVTYRQYLVDPSEDKAQRIKQKLSDAQTHWNQHTQRHASLPGTATAFRERGFWELTQRIMEDVG